MKPNKHNIMHQACLALIAALICSIAVMGGDLISNDEDTLNEAVIHEPGISASIEDPISMTDAEVFDLAPDDTINWQVVGGGATDGNSEQYLLYGTIGQSAAGLDSNSAYVLRSGFWQFFCNCNPGDADSNGKLNILDVTYLINYLYKGGPSPTPYELCSGDADCNCLANILDVTYLINYLYKGGEPPCECENWVVVCGQPIRR